MTLPPPIAAYFEADRRGDREAVAEAFAPDATVLDEGRTHVGRPAIAAWWSETKARYGAELQPLDAAVTDGSDAVVRARVTGDFPGSPAVLRFAFRLAEDGIAALEIGA